ncbi:hypothetical protein [Sulfurospirillum arcachonense]|nr:hypothetical protein [Sulfurospirillum arcachonense]
MQIRPILLEIDTPENKNIKTYPYSFKLAFIVLALSISIYFGFKN